MVQYCNNTSEQCHNYNILTTIRNIYFIVYNGYNTLQYATMLWCIVKCEVSHRNALVLRWETERRTQGGTDSPTDWRLTAIQPVSRQKNKPSLRLTDWRTDWSVRRMDPCLCRGRDIFRVCPLPGWNLSDRIRSAMAARIPWLLWGPYMGSMWRRLLDSVEIKWSWGWYRDCMCMNECICRVYCIILSDSGFDTWWVASLLCGTKI